MPKHVVVIGGGMAGSAAAYALRSAGHDITIVEQSDRLGGRIRSATTGNFTYELGAGFLTDCYENVLAFIKSNHLAGNLVRRRSRGAISRNGHAYQLSAPNLLLRQQPLSYGAHFALLRSLPKLWLQSTKLDIHQVWKSGTEQPQTLAAVLTTRSGHEAIDYFWQPIVDGYCYWSSERTSEVVAALMIKIITGRTYAFTSGLQRLPEVAARGANVLRSAAVDSVHRRPDGTYQITVKGRTTPPLIADGVICATTANIVPKIIAELSPDRAAFFNSVGYSATAVLARTYRPDAAPANRAIAFPRRDGSPLAAVTAVSAAGHTLVKSFASGATGPELCEHSDEAIHAALLGATPMQYVFENPTDEVIQRWPQALPEFSPAHIENLRYLADRSQVLDLDRLIFAGDYLIGPFIEGAFTSGLHAAEKLLRQL